MALSEATFFVDADAGAPLQQQIREHLVHAIATGLLPPGERAPSSRGLAKRLGVSRNTVLIVYQQLTAEGYLVAKERSGLFVSPHLADIASSAAWASSTSPMSTSASPRPSANLSSLDTSLPDETRSEEDSATLAWRGFMKRRSRIDWSRRIPPDWGLYPYPFLEGCFDRDLSFIAEWRDATRAALAAHEFPTWSMDFCEGDDAKLLHEVRTKILPRRGINAREDEILITEGWKQGLDLIVQLFVDQRSRVAVEEPGLPEIRELLRLQRADVQAQALDSEGLIVDDRLQRRDLVIVTPSRQAPTGVVMSRARQKALLKKASDIGALIVEIDVSNSGVGEGAAPALKALDGGQRVFYVANLCAALGPGLRLGVIVAPAPVIRELRKVRSLVAGPAPRAAQRIGALVISLGHHDGATTKVRRAIAERLTALRDALNYYLPRLVLIDPKLSGSSIWVTGPPGLKASLLAKEAAKRGVLIEPANRFFHDATQGDNAFRMGVSSLAIERIRPGVAALAEVMHELTDPSLDRLDPNKVTWLEDAALKRAISGALLLCRTAYGDPYSVEVRADGTLIGKAGYAHEDCDEGVWWIEHGHWCRRWNSWSYGDTARFLTVVEGDQIRWYKDDCILFNRGVIVREHERMSMNVLPAE